MPIVNGRGRVGIRRAGAAAIPSIVLDGLKMYLNAGNAASYAGTGTAWTDLSGNGNNATLVNGAGYSSASGGSVYFDGNNDYVELGASTYFDGITDVTLNFWVLPQTSSAFRTIFSRYHYSSLNNGIQIYHGTDNKFYFGGRESAAAYLDLGTVNTYPIDSWYNVTMTKSGNSWKIYVNGVLENSATMGLGNVAWLAQASAQLGATRQSSGAYYGKSNVAVAMAYNRALSAAEVLQNYNALKLRFVPLTYSIVSDSLLLHLDAGNVKSYYGTGTAWKDLTGNSNGGTLTNGPAYSSEDGGSLVFDATNDYIRMPFETILNDCSIEVWFRGTSTKVYQYLLNLSNLTNSTNALNLDLNDQDAAGAYRTIWVYWNGGGTPLSSVPRTGTNGTNGDWNDSKWRHYVFTRSTTVSPYTQHYMNGSLVTNTVRSGTQTTSFGAGAGYYLTIGAAGNGSNTWGGNIPIVRIYSRVLSASEVLQNYNAQRSRFYPQVSDTDAQAFVYAAGLTSSTQASAVNTLVMSLKSAGIWAKMKAIYPFVGGSAASHKWNLKDPRDLNAAYRLTFTAGMVHSANGVLPNGTSDTANTYLAPLSALSQNSSHISYYSRTNNSTNTVEMSSVGTGNTYKIEINLYGTTYYANVNVNYATNSSTAISDTRGFWLANRNSSATTTGFRNGGKIINASVNSTGLSDRNILLFGQYSATYYSNKQCSFASIGDGLTDTEASDFYNAVQAYQTALGRQV